MDRLGSRAVARHRLTEPARTGARRPYRSPHRERQAARTRAAVLEAARDLFSERGWAGTSIRDVAMTAGVSVETVYATVGSKGDLLVAVHDIAVVGDDAPVPLADRPEFAALGQGSRAARCAAAARLLTQVYRRTARLDLALREAATIDERLAPQVRDDDRRRRQEMASGGQLVAGRPLTDEERDGLWAVLSPDVYLLLTARSGWTSERYEVWATQMIKRLLGVR